MRRLVVITGGTSGIGLETAKLYRKNGDRVIALANMGNEKDKNYMYCDVTSDKKVKECFIRISQLYGKIDILINNAGYGLNGAMELLPLDKVKKQFDVNVFGIVTVTKHALPLMERGGRIINISSAMALFPMPYRSMYAASKAAVSALTFSQRNELKNAGIDVCAVCPGDIKTNFTKNKEVVVATGVRYGEAIALTQAKLDSEKRENKRMKPIVVAKALFKLGGKKRTKPFIIIGGKYKFLYFLSRILPTSWILWGINKIGNTKVQL